MAERRIRRARRTRWVVLPVALSALASAGWLTGLSGAQVGDPVSCMVDLGTLGGDSSFAFDISASGWIVGAAETDDGDTHATLWRPDGSTLDLGTLGGESSGAAFVTNSGIVVGGSERSDGTYGAFAWTEAGGMVDVAPDVNNVAVGVTESGLVTGSYDPPDDGPVFGTTAAFVWSSSLGFVSVHPSIAHTSHIYGTSDDDLVAGVYRVEDLPPDADGATFADGTFVWDATSGLRLIESGRRHEPMGAIGPAGHIVGDFRDSDTEGSNSFRWTAAGGFEDLGHLGDSSQLDEIGTSGLAAGTSFTGEEKHGIVWGEAGGYVDLGLGPIPQAVLSDDTVAGSTGGGVFRWRDGDLEEASPTSDEFPEVDIRSIADSGWIVGTTYAAFGDGGTIPGPAWAWSPDGDLRTLPTLGGETTSPMAVEGDHGWIVGTSETASGDVHGFVCGFDTRPLVLTATNLVGCDEEPGGIDDAACPGGGPDDAGSGDYRVDISVNGQPQPSIGGDRSDWGDFDDGKFLRVNAHLPDVPFPSRVRLDVVDEDENADDRIDIHPIDVFKALTARVNPADSSWRLEAVADSDNQHFAIGDGDTEHAANGGHPAAFQFDISTLGDAADLEELTGDLDGDGLLDGWESPDGLEVVNLCPEDTASCVANPHPVTGPLDTTTVIDTADPGWASDLPDPQNKDLYVENDMLTFDGADAEWDCPAPGGGTVPCGWSSLDSVVDSFEWAPVANPSGTDGIALHVDAGSTGRGGTADLGGDGRISDSATGVDKICGVDENDGFLGFFAIDDGFYDVKDQGSTPIAAGCSATRSPPAPASSPPNVTTPLVAKERSAATTPPPSGVTLRPSCTSSATTWGWNTAAATTTTASPTTSAS